MANSLKDQKKADISFKAILGLYLALSLVLIAETWWFNPPPGSLIAITLIQLIPLLIPLPWVLKRGLRAVAWLCFILCFYFISAVLDVWFRPEQLYGWFSTSFCVLLFVTSMMFIRWQAKVLKDAAATIAVK